MYSGALLLTRARQKYEGTSAPTSSVATVAGQSSTPDQAQPEQQEGVAAEATGVVDEEEVVDPISLEPISELPYLPLRPMRRRLLLIEESFLRDQSDRVTCDL